MPKQTLVCDECEYLFDPRDERAFVSKTGDRRHMCPACAIMSIRSEGMWATWNDCNGVFDVFVRKAAAEAELAQPHWKDGSASVVPVRVIIEPEKQFFYRNWEEHELTKGRAP